MMKFMALVAAALLVATVTDAKKPRRNNGSYSPNDDFQQYSRAYYAVTDMSDYATITPDKPGEPFNIKRSIVGQSQFQSGPVFDIASVSFEDRPNGASKRSEVPGQQFASGKQPINMPDADPAFTMSGECIATGFSEYNDNEMNSHSCVYDLCLGGGGFNCLALYCGTSYTYFPTADNPSNTIVNEPQMPPNFPCTIFGGTNNFWGARGTVDISHITGPTSFKVQPNTGFITQQINVIANIPLPPAP